jgi:putative transposase
MTATLTSGLRREQGQAQGQARLGREEPPPGQVGVHAQGPDDAVVLRSQGNRQLRLQQGLAQVPVPHGEAQLRARAVGVVAGRRQQDGIDKLGRSCPYAQTVSTRLARDPLYRGYRIPAEIISHAVWLYYRFHLSHRDIEDLLAERGVPVSDEAIRLGCRRIGPTFAAGLRRRRARVGHSLSRHSPLATRLM